MPHLLIAGKVHPAGLALLDGCDGFTYDYVEEVTEPSYAPLVGFRRPLFWQDWWEYVDLVPEASR